MKKITLYLFVFIVFASCKEAIKPVLIDNPSDSAVVLQFGDGNEITVKAGEKMEAPVQFGKTTLRIDGGDAMDIELDSEREYLINPTFENYYIQNLVYFYSNRAKDDYEDKFGIQKSTVGGYEVNGSFDEIDSLLVIPKTWVFGLDQTPSQSGRGSTSKGYTKVKKLHRETDLTDMLQAQMMEMLEELISEETEE